MPLVIPLIGLGVFFLGLGCLWARKPKQVPPTGKQPKVSIIIPAYNSYPHIIETINSAKCLDYPQKEIIVVNETRDRTEEVCKKHNVKYIQTATRQGKPKSLNRACKIATGEILFFLDSDTVASKDVLLKTIPWFSDKKIAAVMPRYITKNRNNFLTNLISFDTAFLLSLVRMHMFFGSMIGFRGCGVLIRKSVLKEAGGWPNTLTEDNDLGSKLAKIGLKIQYEPRAVIKTAEAETLKELKRQRVRWGKGSVYSFLHHRKFYMKAPQFLLHNFPYMIIQFALIVLLLFNIFTLNIYGFFYVILTTTIAFIIHVALITLPEIERKRDILLAIPFAAYYLLVSYYYFTGFLSGLRNKKRKLPELVFKEW